MITLKFSLLHQFKLAFTSRIQTTWRLAACLLAMVLVWGTVAAWSQSTGQKTDIAERAQAALPQVVVTVQMPSTDLVVTDIKYRGFFNKIENKFIPLPDYDFPGNLTDEILSALAEDKRAQWRASKSEEKEHFVGYFDPKLWKKDRLTAPPAAVQADRMLLMQASYGAFIHSLTKNLTLIVNVRMVDRTSGRVLWKKVFLEKMGLPAKLEELQAENQKGLKEALNKLMEQIVPKVKRHVAQSKL